jgi:PAS domain S-box-containing protein
LNAKRDRDDPARPGAGAPSPRRDVDGDAQRLVDELRVHQVELELQNEELRATRHALESSLRRYTELFDFAPIGYVVVDAAGAIRELNFAAARLLALDRSKAVGRSLQGFIAAVHAAQLGRFLAHLVTSAEDETPASPIEVHLRASEPLIVRVSGACGQGEPRTALVALEDVTARRIAEDAAREAIQRRDDFLGTLSHELRNPLAPIRNALELLQRVPPPGDVAARAVAVIDRQSAHLSRLVDDLLDVTRIARGKVQLRREVIDLRAVVRRTVDDHRAAFDAAGVLLADDVPADPCPVDADATRLAQVLGNLLGNALKFTGRGGRVEVRLHGEGDTLRLVVRDSGAGVEPELQAQLFQPFSQGAQTLARAAGGLGLGLATVKGLVELHSGTVALASEGPGRGTTVTVTLPRTGTAAPVHPHATAPTARRRVLVIDDNEDGAHTLRDVLETGGHEVRVALDGPAGLQAARDFEPDVVVCDIGLPGMDGYAVARTIRAEPALRGVRLVALSGYARPEDVQRAREAGFDHHVPKPPPLDALAALVAAAPARARAAPPGQASRA